MSEANRAEAAARRLCLSLLVLSAATLNPVVRRPLNAQIVDTLRGHVTAPNGRGVAGARIVAGRQGAIAADVATTDTAGFFHLLLPRDSGLVTVTATAIGFRSSQRTTSAPIGSPVGYPIIVDFRLTQASVRLPVTRVTAPTRSRPRRADLTTLDAGASRDRLSSISDLTGDDPSDLATAISMLPGVSLTPDGFSVLGADPGRNVTTLGGMLFTGPALPRDAVLAMDVGTTTSDASRTGFTGGRLDLTLYTIGAPTRSARLTMDHPAMQWPANPAAAPNARFTSMQMSGYVSDRVGDRMSASASWQVGRRTSDASILTTNLSLPVTASRIASDSIRSLLDAAARQGLPLTAAPERHTATNASLALAWNFAISNDAGIGLSAVAQSARRQGDGLGPFAEASYGRAASSSNLFLLARAHRYFGFVLNEIKLAGNLGRRRSSPDLDAPSARVTIASALDGADPSFTSVALGGNPGAERRDAWDLELNDRTSWMSLSGDHRFDLTLSGRLDGYGLDASTNANGAFVFASLADFRDGRAALFTRSFERRVRSGRDAAAFAALTDAWQPAARLHVTAGVRADVDRFLDPPPYVGLADTLLHVRTDATPSSFVLSPSIGVSWGYGRLPERLKEQFGEAPRATVGAGVASLVGNLPSTLLDPARAYQRLGATPSRLACVGAAAPTPDWALYASDPGGIPTACRADGVPEVFRDQAPALYAFDRGLGPDRALRSNLWWSGRITPRIHARFEVIHSREWNRLEPVDRNLATARGFAMSAEGGRPVFTPAEDIDPQSGTIPLSASRGVGQFGRVYEYRATRRARRTQASAVFTRSTDDESRSVTLGYTYLATRAQMNGFDGTTSGDPTLPEWTRGPSDGTHQITLTGSLHSRSGVTLSVASRASSGYRFTPMVSGDINGDGLANDRAFIADPAAGGDAVVQQGINGLLSTAPARVRRCLRAQLNRIAGANSCRAPWSLIVNLGATVRGGRFGLPARSTLSLSLLNVPAVADRLLHGPARVHGWGQPPAVDATLLQVRGFDPAARRFIYAVNPFFGQAPPAIAALSSPSRLTVGVRIDFGPDPERRFVEVLLHGGLTQLDMPHRDSTTLLSALVGRGPAAVTMLFMSTSSVRLSAAQRRDLLAIRDTTLRRDRVLFAPIAGYLASLHEDFNADDVQQRLDPALAASARIAETATRSIRALLTRAQLQDAPPYLLRVLDPEWAAAQRRLRPLAAF